MNLKILQSFQGVLRLGMIESYLLELDLGGKLVDQHLVAGPRHGAKIPTLKLLSTRSSIPTSVKSIYVVHPEGG